VAMKLFIAPVVTRKKTVLERINTVASARKFMRLEITTAVFLQNEEVFLDW
jgi:hypothetical protein